MLTSARLREVLDYDPLTGVFRRRIACGHAKAGDVAGTINGAGYRQISVDGRIYLASRLTWLHTHGRWPQGEIDHKNGITNEDWLKNLRDVTPSGNQQNMRRAQKNNRTGLLGAHRFRGKFKAQISVDGKRRHLGLFPTAELAHTAYVVAKRQLHATCTI